MLLPGAGRADDERAGPARDLERNAAQRLDILFAALERLADVGHADHARLPRGARIRIGRFHEASLRIASIGVIREARQAGYRPASVAITIAVTLLAATSSAVSSSLSSNWVRRS